MAELSSGDQAGVNRAEAAGEARTDRELKNDLQQRNDRSAWNWLLVPAIVVPLLVPLYNRVEPTLFGWPFFYWGQLAFIALGVAITSVVYQVTKSPKEPDPDWPDRGSEGIERKGS
ncbi:MAG: DUF3311 domain-containing protein [Geodermatophilaceae bacterium]|nr:DUF3311 domain-containing protein [Geodermatophilaceae bacterium]